MRHPVCVSNSCAPGFGGPQQSSVLRCLPCSFLLPPWSITLTLYSSQSRGVHHAPCTPKFLFQSQQHPRQGDPASHLWLGAKLWATQSTGPVVLPPAYSTLRYFPNALSCDCQTRQPSHAAKPLLSPCTSRPSPFNSPSSHLHLSSWPPLPPPHPTIPKTALHMCAFQLYELPQPHCTWRNQWRRHMHTHASWNCPWVS
jgi:hypothetical protein